MEDVAVKIAEAAIDPSQLAMLEGIEQRQPAFHEEVSVGTDRIIVE